jgi:hypothetical protein
MAIASVPRALSPSRLSGLWLHGWLTWTSPAALVLVFLAAFLIRLPTRTSYLVNWDSVQFALATEGFDLHHHRPHPPGYIGYIALARGLNLVTGDANASLVLISVVCGAIAVSLFYVLAGDILPRRRAVAATLLFGTSPLLWYYSGVALTYAPEAALATGFGVLAWRGRRRGGWWLAGASLALAGLGAVRQTGAVLLLPLWLWCLWAATTRERAAALATLAAACLAWSVPLVALSGGPVNYVVESRALAGLAGGSTAIYGGNVAGIGRNWFMVGAGMLAAAGGGALALIGLLRRFGDRQAADEGFPERTFLVAWAVPPLAVFLLMHMGQAGYALLIAPPLLILLARAWPEDLLSHRAGAMALGAAAVFNAAIVLWLPGAVHNRLPPDTPLAGHVRQYAPSASDQHWQALAEFVAQRDGATTAILAALGGPRSSGSFRHLSYYVRDVPIYASGPDTLGRYGHLYTAFRGIDDYQIADLPAARSAIALPTNIRAVLIADAQVARFLAPEVVAARYELRGGGTVWLLPVVAGSVLVFGEAADGSPEITVMPGQLGDDEWPGLVEASAFLTPENVVRAPEPEPATAAGASARASR